MTPFDDDDFDELRREPLVPDELLGGGAWPPTGEGFDALFGARTRWPLDAHGLLPRERPVWYEQLWTDACMLRDRYRLGLRSGWWEDELQVEAIAALGAWVERYDSGEWDDPPGKLALLYDLERVGQLLRDGREPFHPVRDRPAFERFVADTARRSPGR
jgi:hypothetical protein